MSRAKSPQEKRLAGNPGRYPIPETVDLDPMVCIAPSWLDAAAVTIWDRVAGELSDRGLLRDIDRDLLGAYCQHLANGIAAQMVINEHGLINDVGKKRPEVLIMRDSFETARLTAKELGFTPDARYRGRLSGNKSDKEKENKAAKYGIGG